MLSNSMKYLVVSMACIALTRCGTPSTTSSTLSTDPQSSSKATKLSISVGCDKMNPNSHLKARLVLHIEGMKNGLKRVDKYRSSDGEKIVYGSDGVRENYSINKVLLDSNKICAESRSFNAEDINKIITKTVKDSMSDLVEPSVIVSNIAIEIYQPAGFLSKEVVKSHHPVADLEDGAFSPIITQSKIDVPELGKVQVNFQN